MGGGTSNIWATCVDCHHATMPPCNYATKPARYQWRVENAIIWHCHMCSRLCPSRSHSIFGHIPHVRKKQKKYVLITNNWFGLMSNSIALTLNQEYAENAVDALDSELWFENLDTVMLLMRTMWTMLWKILHVDKVMMATTMMWKLLKRRVKAIEDIACWQVGWRREAEKEKRGNVISVQYAITQ